MQVPAHTVSGNVRGSELAEIYVSVPIWIGIACIIMAFVYLKVTNDRKLFRRILVVSHLLIAAELMHSKQLNFWIGFSLFLLWFAAAGYVVWRERKERK